MREQRDGLQTKLSTQLSELQQRLATIDGLHADAEREAAGTIRKLGEELRAALDANTNDRAAASEMLAATQAAAEERLAVARAEVGEAKKACESAEAALEEEKAAAAAERERLQAEISRVSSARREDQSSHAREVAAMQEEVRRCGVK